MLWNLIVTGMLVTWASEPFPNATVQAGAVDRARICPSADEIPVSLIGMSEYFRQTVYMTHGEAEHTRVLCVADLDTVPASAQNCDGAIIGSPNAAAPANHNFWDASRYDKNRRVQQMAEDIRQIEDDWARVFFADERFWDAHCPFNIPCPNQWSHLTYDRITGGLE